MAAVGRMMGHGVVHSPTLLDVFGMSAMTIEAGSPAKVVCTDVSRHPSER